MAKGSNGNLKIEYRPIGKLMPYARNARTHSAAQVDHIVALIREFGWTNPILVDGKSGILAGHGRLQAAKQLGYAHRAGDRTAGALSRQEAGVHPG